jgi:hypothetical protein
MVMPRVDCGYDRNRILLRDPRCRIGGQRGDADRGLTGGQRDGARGRDAHAQSSEAARADRHRNPVEIAERKRGLRHHAGDQRDERLGMAALHHAGLTGNDRVLLGIQYCRRAGGKRGVDGKDTHPIARPMLLRLMRGRPTSA